MTDYGYPLRKKYIAESATLDAKRAELRARMMPPAINAILKRGWK